MTPEDSAVFHYEREWRSGMAATDMDKFTVNVVWSDANGFVATCPNVEKFKHLSAFGSTHQEALQGFDSLIKFVLKDGG